jgi:hypothetical protein
MLAHLDNLNPYSALKVRIRTPKIANLLALFTPSCGQHISGVKEPPLLSPGLLTSAISSKYIHPYYFSLCVCLLQALKRFSNASFKISYSVSISASTNSLTPLTIPQMKSITSPLNRQSSISSAVEVPSLRLAPDSSHHPPSPRPCPGSSTLDLISLLTSQLSSPPGPHHAFSAPTLHASRLAAGTATTPLKTGLLNTQPQNAVSRQKISIAPYSSPNLSICYARRSDAWSSLLPSSGHENG